MFTLFALKHPGRPVVSVIFQICGKSSVIVWR